MLANPAIPGPWSIRSQSRWWLVVALVYVLVRSLHELAFPIYRDQATYCLIGQSLWEGKHLYRDVWDNKPPGIFYIYALIVKLFGPVMWSVGVADILCLLLISYFVFRFAVTHTLKDSEEYLGEYPQLAHIIYCEYRAVESPRTLVIYRWQGVCR